MRRATPETGEQENIGKEICRQRRAVNCVVSSTGPELCFRFDYYLELKNCVFSEFARSEQRPLPQ